MLDGNNIIQNVSRETLDNLKTYERLLRQWQERINLVADSTLLDLWNRHFVDSYQLVNITNDVISQKDENVSRETFFLADLGSGAGFPGMVLALAGIPNVNLIESDQRKCAFLRDVSRETFGTKTDQHVSRETFRPTIHNKRIENVALKSDIITSRAFADLAKTLEISSHLRHEKTVYLLLKPLDMEKELAESARNWYFKYETIPSVADPRGCVLKVYDVVNK